MRRICERALTAFQLAIRLGLALQSVELARLLLRLLAELSHLFLELAQQLVASCEVWPLRLLVRLSRLGRRSIRRSDYNLVRHGLPA